MTPEQAQAHGALILIGRLVRHRGLTVEEAVTAVAQRRRHETGPHTDLVTAEARAVAAEMTARLREALRTFADACRPMIRQVSEAVTELSRTLRNLPHAPGARPTGRNRRPAWASPYGPPPPRHRK